MVQFKYEKAREAGVEGRKRERKRWERKCRREGREDGVKGGKRREETLN